MTQSIQPATVLSLGQVKHSYTLLQPNTQEINHPMPVTVMNQTKQNEQPWNLVAAKF